ncbi:hypothetical protein [Actinospica robiniae]|uniref:hypothetical protein n=1 Tax=Actinospica robiniae TaxID=304901 RepID=UPI0003FAD359|nr:hypothetical protein [Actinospica robiniae]
MSSADERNALDFAPAPDSLIAQAQRLLREYPDGPPRPSWHPFPEPPGPDDPESLQDDGSGRTLIQQGTTRQTVLRGLELLEGKAVPSDVPMLKLIGLLGFASVQAAGLLRTIPGAAHDLIWLAEHAPFGRSRIVEHLLSNTDAVVRDWVLSTPHHLMQGELARKIAERCQISRKLAGLAVEPRLWDQAGNLLVAMASTRTYRCEIRRYEQATADYWHWITLAARMPASLDRAALLTMVGQDVTTGPAAPIIEDDATRMLAAINAVQYDREVARAEQDHGWEWPARTAARLIHARIRAEPSLFGQWDCRLSGCTSWPSDVDSVRLSFMYPAERPPFEDPRVRFGFVIGVDGRDPQAVAQEFVASLGSQDPKLSAEIIGGRRDEAERLGLRYRKPSRWMY